MPEPGRLKITPRIQAAAKRRRLMIERQDLLATYRTDPVSYGRNELGVGFTDDQERALRTVVDSRRTAIQGSHGIGKTYLLAVLSSWWFDCWQQHICYITAPTWDAAKEKVFAQLKILRQRAGLGGRVMETGFIKDEDKNNDPLHFVRTLNAESGEAFQGEHKAPILILLDESPGVPGYIWTSARGLMTGAANRLVAVGNPTDSNTPFGKACKDKNYTVLRISALDHPNIQAELECKTVPYPENDLGLLWLKEMLDDEAQATGEPGGGTFEFWSIATLIDALNGIPVSANPNARKTTYLPTGDFEARVLGRFPTQAFEQVIPESWLTDLKPKTILPQWIPEIGADIARQGDDRTCIVIRLGPVVLRIIQIRRLDLAVVTGAIVDAINWAAQHVGCNPRAILVRVDITGGLGAGPYDFLREQGFNAEGVNSSNVAFDTEKFKNRRSELWFSSRDRIYTGDLDLSRLPRDDRETLIRELSLPKYDNDSRGRKIVEEKKVIKKRMGGDSPDVADAFNLAFSPSGPQAAETEVEYDPFGYEDERL
jgi:phage terminase large subunit